MFCQSNPPGLTVEQLMDQLYPQVFSTFTRSNPALQQRADFYKIFFNTFNVNVLFKFGKITTLQVFELGSGTGIGSANNLKLLSEKFPLGVNYVATDKRSQLASMTRKNLAAVLNQTISSAAAYLHDSLHYMAQKQLRNFGLRDGSVHVYFAEHSTYSELYDIKKTLAYLSSLRSLIKECGIGFIVVQTEHAEMQKLVERNIGPASDYSKHIVNFENAITSLNWKVLAKYLNQVLLTFPKLTTIDWQSIRSRESDLACFGNKEIGTTIELMTFIKKPLNCLNNTELNAFVDTIQSHLTQNNNRISIDEYIYVIANNCSVTQVPFTEDNSQLLQEKSVGSNLTETKSHGLSPLTEAALFGFLRGATSCMNVKLLKNGLSKTKAKVLSQSTCLLGFFATKVCSRLREQEWDYLNILYNAAIETGCLFFFNIISNKIDKFLEKSAIQFERPYQRSWMSTGINMVRGLLPFGIFAANEDKYTASVVIAIGSGVEFATKKVLNY